MKSTKNVILGAFLAKPYSLHTIDTLWETKDIVQNYLISEAAQDAGLTSEQHICTKEFKNLWPTLCATRCIGFTPSVSLQTLDQKTATGSKPPAAKGAPTKGMMGAKRGCSPQAADCRLQAAGCRCVRCEEQNVLLALCYMLAWQQ